MRRNIFLRSIRGKLPNSFCFYFSLETLKSQNLQQSLQFRQKRKEKKQKSWSSRKKFPTVGIFLSRKSGNEKKKLILLTSWNAVQASDVSICKKSNSSDKHWDKVHLKFIKFILSGGGTSGRVMAFCFATPGLNSGMNLGFFSSELQLIYSHWLSDFF